ncbi:hypothetical protein [Streptomyces sp. NPDC001985]|uniref:hypothetical protein n=1 Tax=Streptomyces sp. NPDC001985 TaxID=3154406 RepID=UPI0033329CC1
MKTCTKCGQTMTQTQDGWWICYPCGTSEPALNPSCPRCEEKLKPGRAEWWVCAACDYEIAHEALCLHLVLVASIEESPEEFFSWVRKHRDELRSEEPVWQRTHR